MTASAVESLSAASTSGVLLDLSAVVMLLCAFAALGSKLFDRYVSYYALQSIVLSFAAAVVGHALGQVDLWVLAVATLLIKGIAIPLISSVATASTHRSACPSAWPTTAAANESTIDCNA